MDQTNLSFEQIDQHVAQNLASLQPSEGAASGMAATADPDANTANAAAGTSGASTGAAANNDKLCQIYTTVRPVLSSLASAFFIPQNWRTAIKTFLEALDAICPQAATAMAS